jgi:hypoxanthine phosphoribosyltransferase
MRRDIESISYSAETISERVSQLGAQITEDFRGKNPVLLGILKGSFVFLADLARQIDTPCEVQFMKASSYGAGTVSSGTVKVAQGLPLDIKGRDVLVVEDIIDSGITLAHLVEFLRGLEPKSIHVCAFLDKKECRTVEVDVEYIGFVCENSFFVGYGLDFAEKYRNLPYIGVLKPEIYS